MGTKALQAKIVGLSQDDLRALQHTHQVFNDLVAQMAHRFLQMRKGKPEEEYRNLAQFVVGQRGTNQLAHAIMEPLTRPQWSSSRVAPWCDLVRDILAKHGLLLDRTKDGFGNSCGFTVCMGRKPARDSGKAGTRQYVSSEFWRKVCEGGSQVVRGNKELMAIWRRDRVAWLEERKRWEDQNSEFIRIWRERFVSFEEECEKDRQAHQAAAKQRVTHRKRYKPERGKRWSRWPLYLKWLESNPELVAWRGKAEAGDFEALTDEDRVKVQATCKREHKRTQALLKGLFEKNLELKTLDDLRRAYVANYLRFKRPPTLTFPNAQKHPHWCQFKRGATYKELDLQGNRVALKVLRPDSGAGWQEDWITVSFLPDPRLTPDVRARRFAAQGILPPIDLSVAGKSMRRAKNGQSRHAAISGIKLIFKNKRPYLVFTVQEQDMPPKAVFRKLKKKSGSRADYLHSPDGTSLDTVRVLAVDLGLRRLAACAIGEGHKIGQRWETAWLNKLVLKTPRVPGLRDIRHHEWELRCLRSRQGRAPRGQRTFVQLQDHITSAGKDRFKKGARAVVDLAVQHDVHVIVLERLGDYMPTAFDERWANRRLRQWNKRNLAHWIEQLAVEHGIGVSEVSPYLSSQLCSCCRLAGFRYSVTRKQPWREGVRARSECDDFGQIVFDRGGHLFACPHCGHRANADINAACNLALRFFGNESPVRYDKDKKAFFWDDEDVGSTGFEPEHEFAQWVKDTKPNHTDTPEVPW